MKTKLLILAFSLVAMLCMGSVSLAAPVETWGSEIEIVGYDVISTLALEERTGPGGVGTSAYYTGSVSGGTYKNYTGGEGTLNDGVTDGGINDGQQMFETGIGSAIILYLNTQHQYNINGLFFSGGDPFSGNFLPNNALPGGISGMSMVVGSVNTEVISTVQENFVPGPYPFLWEGVDDTFVDDYIDLTGDEYSSLRAEAVQSIVLTNFTADSGVFGDIGQLFTLSEIQIYGEIYVPEDPVTTPVPEPSTFLLLGLGLITVVLVGRKRCRVRA